MATQHDTAHGHGPDATTEALPTDADAPADSWRRSAAVIGAALVLVLVAAGIYLGQRDSTPRSVTVTERGGQAAQPAGPVVDPVTGLHATVSGPTSVRVGQAATYTVHWTDDDGVLVGSTQSWGDTGDGATKQGRCATHARVPSDSTFAESHTWTRAGTYVVTITVTTQSCSTGAATTEDSSATTSVVVAAD